MNLNKIKQHLVSKAGIAVLLNSGLLAVIIWFINALPEPLFVDDTATVVLDETEQLLGARIANDEQWRFAPVDSVPFRFKTCIVAFEDRDFFRHNGVSIKAIGRAIKQNLSNQTRVSGASTISMQVIRLMRKNPPRTYQEKIKEVLLALRLELRYDKDEILNLYASHAPFGSNVVGLEAASWRYFNRPSFRLSWAESATLAVLPNAPGLIYPGRNDAALKRKRNQLLHYLVEQRYIDSTTFELALLEPLPKQPLPLPNLAPHLLARLSSEGKKGKTTVVTVQKDLQTLVNKEVRFHLEKLAENKIHNAAVIVAEVKTGKIISYIGNQSNASLEQAKHVDCAKAKRSTGSVLKPLLFAKAMDEGIISPKSLLPDIPSKFGAFSPKNFANQFSGLIPADEALSRSLNIPMVHLLQQYGVTKFHSDLRELGFNTLTKSAQHYGLSLILGGAEITLFDLCQVYMTLVQQLNNSPFKSLHYSDEAAGLNQPTKHDKYIQNASLYAMFEAMVSVQRPDEDNLWQLFSSSKKIAWKTGTSFGFRDAWSIGITPDYVVGVWVGNANGEGRPGLTGIKAAAPLMFTVFDLLPTHSSWFNAPLDGKQVTICRASGALAGKNCQQKDICFGPEKMKSLSLCNLHKVIHLDQSQSHQVNADCYPVQQIKPTPWLVIPPHIAKYYKEHHPSYESPPPFSPDCQLNQQQQSLALIYPKNEQVIFLPKDFDGKVKPFIAEASTFQSSTAIYWHLNDSYIGTSTELHQMAIILPIGEHLLSVVDELGNSATVRFKIIAQ